MIDLESQLSLQGDPWDRGLHSEYRVSSLIDPVCADNHQGHPCFQKVGYALDNWLDFILLCAILGAHFDASLVATDTCVSKYMAATRI